MKGEILSIETVEKLNRIEKVIKYIENKIQASFKTDYGIEQFNRNDRLFTETVIELQIIKDMLEGRNEK